MKLPAEWARLTEARRRELWNMAQRPERTVQYYYSTMATTRMLLDMRASGLIDCKLTWHDGKSCFVAAATPAGRWVIAEVERRAAEQAGRELWAWIQQGPGLQTRADY